MNRDNLDRLLHILADLDGSDMHIKAGACPRVRVDGLLRTLDDEPQFTEEDTLALARAIMPAKILEVFEDKREADFAYSVPGLGRFRTNAFYQRSSVALAMRRVRTTASTFEDLRLPDVVRRLSEHHRGLVLVTGPTGSGKTTTLAAMVDHINHVRSCHVITIEDPIEYVYRHQRGIVEQREVGADVPSFADGLRAALRQTPDVLLIGEMRDLETISAAITIAETGHLVLATLHTNDTAQAIDRMVDVFPGDQQQQVRVQLSSTLAAVIYQQLLPRRGGPGRIAAFEVLLNTLAVQNLIKEGKTRQLRNVLETGAKDGMNTMERSLGELVRSGMVDFAAAAARSQHPEELRRLAA